MQKTDDGLMESLISVRSLPPQIKAWLESELEHSWITDKLLKNNFT